MKRPRQAALAATLLFSVPAFGQVVNLVGTGQATDLQCPARIREKRVPVRPAPEPEQDVLEPPSLDELDGVLPAESHAGGETVFKPASRASQRPPTIAFWGDSHLAAHFFQDELIRLTGLKRSRVQPSFIPPTMGRAGVRLPIRKYCQGDGWTYRYAYLSQSAQAAFAPGLSQLRSQNPGAYLWIDFRLQPGEAALSALDILFSPQQDGGAVTSVAVAVDDGEEQIVALDAEGRLRVQADRPFSIVRLRLVEGNLALEGFKPAYVEPAIARIDTLAIPGATARGWANSSPEYFRSRMDPENYDFVVLEYGTNEGNQRSFNEQGYAAELRAALGNMRRVFPAAQCLLIGPTDRGVLVRHRKTKPGNKKARQPAPHSKPELLHYAKIHQQISDIQRKVGNDFNCGFWGWQKAMGGVGGAYRWLYHTPRLMAKDLIHLTIPGYQQSAREFADAVRFSDWLSGGESPR